MSSGDNTSTQQQGSSGVKSKELAPVNPGTSVGSSAGSGVGLQPMNTPIITPAQSLQSLVEYHKMHSAASGTRPVALSTSDTPREPPLHAGLPSLQTAASSASTTGATNNTCQICQKQFQRWEQLKRHLVTHTDARPYECKVCGKRFQLQNKMQRHEQTHSGIKPFQCPLCAVKVSRKEHLRRHMLVHSEAKPYKCSLCDHTARRLDSIQGHVKQKHSDGTATVVSLYKQPGYQDSLEALTKSLEQSIQGPPGDSSSSAVTGSVPSSKSGKKKGSKKRKRSNPVQIENCTQTEQKQGLVQGQSGGNKDAGERGNTTVFPEFMPDGALSAEQLVKCDRRENDNNSKSEELTHKTDKSLDKEAEHSLTERSLAQQFYGKEDTTATRNSVKTEPSTTGLTQMPWQHGQGQGQSEGQQQGFIGPSTAYPAQLFVNQALGLCPGQPQVSPGNQAISQSYWPEQSRFTTPVYPAGMCQPSVQSGAVAVQSPYFNPSAGFCGYSTVAANPGTNIVPPSSLNGQTIPEFFKKRIRQGTQELNKIAEECSSDKQGT